MTEAEGNYYWTVCPAETDKILIVEKVERGYFLMGCEEIYPPSQVRVISAAIPPPLLIEN